VDERAVERHKFMLEMEISLYRLSHGNPTEDQIKAALALILSNPSQSFQDAMERVK
jgi:hypothetical protein